MCSPDIPKPEKPKVVPRFDSAELFGLSNTTGTSRVRSGFQSTLLTGPLGRESNNTGARKTLLGQ